MVFFPNPFKFLLLLAPVISILGYGTLGRAQEVEDPEPSGSKPVASETAEEVLDSADIKGPDAPTAAETATAVSTSRSNRALSHGVFTYAPYVPGFIVAKHGPTAGYIADPNWTIELEYLTGQYDLDFYSVEFASFREDLKLVRARWYPDTNSFGLMFGLGLRTYRVKLGTDVANNISTAADLRDPIEIENLVIHLGLGNRWQTDSGFTWGFDWFDLYVPLARTRYSGGAVDRLPSEGGRRHVEGGVSALAKIPTFSFLKLNLGWAI